MRITRYVTVELLKIFVVTLTALTGLLLLGVLAQEALRQGLGPLSIVRLIPYVLPIALRFAIPATILFAACGVYGRMSAANEILSVQSLGISPFVVVRPALIVALGISLVTVWINDVAVTWGKLGVNRVVLQSVEQIAYGMLRSTRSYSGNRFSITVRRVDGRKLIRPTLVFRTSEDAAPITLQAQEAELQFDARENLLTFIMVDSELEGAVTGRLPDTTVHKVSLNTGASTPSGPSDLALWQIPRAVKQQRQAISRMEETLAADAAFQMIRGDFTRLSDPKWQFAHTAIENEVHRFHRMRTEPWRRWANGFSCLFFVMVGAPLAIRLRTADLWTSFAACFLPILALYYPLLMYGVDRAKCGVLPPYSVWLGNLMLGLAGCWLMRKVQRS